MELPVYYDSIPRNERWKVRNEYVKQQKGRCYYCDCPLDGQPDKAVTSKKITERLFPPGFFDHPVHLHHDHNTGLTLGAVHNYCNAVLWEYYGE